VGGVKNTFASHFFLWIFLIPLCLLLATPLFFDPPDMQVSAAERASLESSGIDTASIDSKAESVFTSTFVKSGAVRTTMGFCASKPHTTITRDIKRKNSNYCEGVWLMTYQWLWRLLAFGGLLGALMIVLLAPALVDGWVKRSIKAYEFGQYSGPVYYAAKHFVIVCAGCLCVVPLLPITLTPLIVLTVVIAMSFAARTVASNFQAV
jgi:hypothetical protein